MNKSSFIKPEDRVEIPKDYNMYGYLHQPIRTDKTYYLFGFIKLETIHNVTYKEAKDLLKPYLKPFVKIRYGKFTLKRFLKGKIFATVALYYNFRKNEEKYLYWLDKSIYEEAWEDLT